MKGPFAHVLCSDPCYSFGLKSVKKYKGKGTFCNVLF